MITIPTKKDQKMKPPEFVLKAIERLRKPGSLGIHVVFSGFNKAFEDYFGFKSRETLDEMIGDGEIESRMRRGGPMIYFAGEAPQTAEAKAQEALKKIMG